MSSWNKDVFACDRWLLKRLVYCFKLQRQKKIFYNCTLTEQKYGKENKAEVIRKSRFTAASEIVISTYKSWFLEAS